MKEIKAVISAFNAQKKKHRKAALATLVHLDGSSYRQPGARLLVDEMGNMTGAISGGCLEGDAYRKASQAISSGKARVVTYDTSDEEDATIGAQLGCAGIIQVLFEPIDTVNPQNPIQLLEWAGSSRKPSVLVTLYDGNDVFGTHPGTCLCFDEDLNYRGWAVSEDGITALKKDVIQAFTQKRSKFTAYNEVDFAYQAFIEFLPPPVSLVVIGAGNDAVPLVQMAEILGWQTTVIDGRGQLAKQERFTSSCQIIVSKPEAVLEQLNIDDQTAFVLMTHNYNYDYKMLVALMKKMPAYLGLLGPRKKFERMLDDMQTAGLAPHMETLSQVFAPIGLEIGAESPEEIALSILSEIKAALSRTTGGYLKNKVGTIHSRKGMDSAYSEHQSHES